MVDSAAATKPDLLIVDDDPLITDTLDFVLGRDFNVYVAESRNQVKSLLRQLGRTPELALVDLDEVDVLSDDHHSPIQDGRLLLPPLMVALQLQV